MQEHDQNDQRDRNSPVTAPERQGFGSRLINTLVSTELGTPVEMRYEPSGLVCEFDGPLQKKPAAQSPASA
jgi:two-component sensor histidine kinase